MSIKSIRQDLGLSQKQFADKFEIPVRTLQQWEQGKSSPAPYIEKMIRKLVEKEELDEIVKRINDPNRYRVPKKTKWKVCIDDPFMNCEKVYPIQQRKVRELLDDILDDGSVKEVIVFGSSVTERCHIGSDVDIYVSLESEKSPITKAHDFAFDLWTDSMVDERLMKEINEKGVKVYG